MSDDPRWVADEVPRSDVPVDPAVREFARIEGLVGEELALLGVPEGDRTHEQRDRLERIARELDRLWDLLRERAERLAHRDEPEGGAATR